MDKIQPPNDPLYHFFMSAYETTKKMPDTSQHFVKQQVYKAVSDMEATLLNIPLIPTQQTSQLDQCNIQHQDNPCTDHQFSSSGSLSFSEDSSHQSSPTQIHDGSAEEVERHGNTLVNFSF